MHNIVKKLSLGMRSLFMPRFKILAYHGVPKANPSLYEVSVAQLREQMKIISDQGFQVLDLDMALQQLQDGVLSKKTIVITFDDAHESIGEYAAPVLMEFCYPAAIFVPTGLTGKKDPSSGDHHHSRRIVMTWEKLGQLKEMGFSMGSHSVSHCNLLTERIEIVKYEIEVSYRNLLDQFGQGKYYFAYPFGLLDKYVHGLVAASPYVGAVCFGSVLSNWIKTDPYLLKREKVLATTSRREFQMLINPAYDFIRALKAQLIKIKTRRFFR